MAIIAGYYLEYELKKIGIKDIPLSKSDYIILATYIIYPTTAIIFAAIGMEYIAGWMISLGFIALGGYTIYISKQWISKRKMQTIFGYYDQKKNSIGFITVTAIHIIFGILEIGFGIFVFTVLV